jgi:hypothetical protein
MLGVIMAALIILYLTIGAVFELAKWASERSKRG